MTKRPDNLAYAVDDLPPLLSLAFLGLQQVALIGIYLVMVVIVVHAARAPQEVAESAISFSMIALGAGAVLQALWKGPVGSGYLAPPVLSAVYLQPSVLAAQMGGLPLVFGMTILAGLFESILSRILHKLRRVFPPLVCGLIVTAVGIELGLVGMKQLLDIQGIDTANFGTHVAVAVLTLALMVGLAVWGRGLLRMFCSLVGVVVGVIAAYFAGILSPGAIAHIAETPLFELPNTGHIGYGFNLAIAVPFLISALAAGLRTIGVVTTCQQINNADWKHPDMDSIKGGVLADGLGCTLGGLLGAAPGMSSAPSAVGVSKATGATSRYIALAIGGWFLVLACLPKLAAFFFALPLSVVGAGLVFNSSLMMVAGIQIIASQDLNTRRTLIIGISLLLGLSHEVFPTYFKDLPNWLQLISSSLLSITAVSAILLNLLFQIGIRRSHTVTVELADGSRNKLANVLRQDAKAWGTDAETLQRAAAASTQILELIQDRHLADDVATATISFDEVDFIVDVAYHGTLLHLPPDRPQPEELVEEKSFSAGLAGYFVSVYPDRVQGSAKDSTCHIRLVFHI